jgi:hypothetical protein
MIKMMNYSESRVGLIMNTDFKLPNSGKTVIKGLFKLIGRIFFVGFIWANRVSGLIRFEEIIIEVVVNVFSEANN